MKLTRTKATLPRLNPDRALELDIFPFPDKAGVGARVLVFDQPRDLRKFWKKQFRFDVGKECLGVVRELVVDVDRRRERRIDPTCFCVIGLSYGYLGCEILSHECVHAGIAWLRWTGKEDVDEEELAFAVGKIFRALVNSLRAKNLV